MSRTDSIRVAAYAGISRLLLVTTRNLAAPTGEWRLIANRSAALVSQFRIKTDVLCLRPDGSGPMPLSGADWHESVEAIRFRNHVALGSCSDIFRLRRSIQSWLRDHPHGYIVISGFQLYLMPLRIPKQRLIIDLHGTLREWSEGGSQTMRSLLLRAGYPVVSLAEKRALAGARGALVVSKALETYAQSCGVREVWRIPCGLLRSAGQAGTHREREEWRQRLSIAPESTAFVYSGGLSRWQCVREAIQLFEHIQKEWPGDCRLIIMTPRTEALQALTSGLNTRVLAYSVAPEDVGAALSACDIGLLLRDDTSTNHSAFPNKFAEYVAAGLFVITSPGLKDPSEFVSQHGIGVLIDPQEIRSGVSSEWTRLLHCEYNNREPHAAYRERAKALALKELSMEHLVEPFAESLSIL